MRKIKSLIIIVFAIFVLCLVQGCGALDAIANITGIKIDENTISWDKLSDKYNDYDVIVNGEKQTLENQNSIEVSTDSQNIDFQIKNANYDEYISVTFKKLPDVTLTLNGNTADWSTYQTANPELVNLGYIVMIDGVKGSVITETSTIVPPGDHTVNVRAVVIGDNTYYSSFGTGVTATVLSVPSVITYSRAEITWSPVERATSYICEVNGEEYETNVPSLSTLEIDTTEGLSIRVKAVSENYSSNFSEMKIYRSVKKIEGTLAISDGVISWNPAAGATGYIVEVDGVVQNEVLTEPKYDKLTPGTSYSIRVRAIVAEANETFSPWSDPTVVNILTAPVLQYETKGFFWDDIDTADGYRIRISKQSDNGEENEIIIDEELRKSILFYRDYAFNDTGNYFVQVMSLGNTGDKYDSKWSEAMEVIRLPAPTKYAIADDLTPNGKLIIAFNDVSSYVSHYSLYMDGTEVTSNMRTIFEIPKPITFNQRDYIITIKSRSANENAINNRVVLSSIEELRLTIRKLAVPQNIRFKENEKNTIIWDEVADNHGYGVVMSDLFSTSKNEFAISEISAGAFYTRVYAKGEINSQPIENIKIGDEISTDIEWYEKDETNLKIVSSDFSSTVEMQKLRAPVNLRVVDSNLTWDAVPGCTGYLVTIDGEQLGDITTNSYVAVRGNEEIEKRIKETGSYFTVTALGNSNKSSIDVGEIPTLDSSLSQTTLFYKLSSPTNLQVTDSGLSWNSVPNAQGYLVYVNDFFLMSVSSTYFDVSNLDGGSYSLSVIAVGDNEDNFNSDRSEKLEVKKLNMVEVTRTGKMYTWPADPDAVKYDISIDGRIDSVENSQGLSVIEYTPEFEQSSEPYVVITAIGNNGAGEHRVIKSNDLIIRQQTKKLPTPAVINGEIISYKESEGMLLLEANDKNELGFGYDYVIAGISNKVLSDSSLFTFIPQSAGTITINLRHLGEVFDENGIYYYTSNMSETSVTVRFLPPVLESEIIVSDRGLVKWTSVGDAQYDFHYEIHDENGIVFSSDWIKNGSHVQYQIPDFKDKFTGKGYKLIVCICATGNSLDTISSNSISSIEINII